MNKLISSFLYLIPLAFMINNCNRGSFIGHEKEPITTVILLRHAEKIGETDELDPALGLNRAQELARLYSNSGIQHIYSSNYNRTVKTAQPLANQLGLHIKLYSTDSLETLCQKIKSIHLGEVVMVIGHSNTLPKTIQLLGVSKSLSYIPFQEYDNIYTMTFTGKSKAKMIKKKYGLKSPTPK